MIRSKTVFVVGAGASSEIGLPTGNELRRSVANLLDIKFPDGWSQTTGDRLITEALRLHVRTDRGSGDINPYLRAAWHIRDAMPQSLSIDNFLDAHQEDERVNLCGKLAIIRAILLAEAASHLRTDERSNVNFNGPENPWYTGLFQLLSEGIRLKDVERMLEGISFVIFNYDRAVEHYLHGAVMNYFRVDSAIATSVVRRAKFLHPYGRIAELPWQNPEGVRYGGAEDGVHYLKLARNIQTFTEQVADTQALAELKNAIQESSQLVFLGFAFHPQNMQLLMPSQSTDVTRVFATAYGFSKSDSDIVREEIRRSVVKDGREYLIHLRSDLTCNQLFREYWRSLR